MTVSEQIIQVLDALCEKFGLVVDWTNANVVPYLTELCSRVCTYEIASSIFWLIFGAVVLISGIIYYKNSWKNQIDWREYNITKEQVNGVLSIIFLVVCGITGTVIICVQTLDIIQAICLPELTIMNKITNLTTYTSVQQ